MQPPLRRAPSSRAPSVVPLSGRKRKRKSPTSSAFSGMAFSENTAMHRLYQGKPRTMTVKIEIEQDIQVQIRESIRRRVLGVPCCV